MSKLAIIVGSVFGGAENLAQQIAKQAEDKQLQAQLFVDATLNQVMEFQANHWLVVTSTTGQGDFPPNIEPFFYELQTVFPMLNDVPSAVIGMGDSSYSDSFCGASLRMEELLRELGSSPLQPLLTIDAGEHFEPMDGAKTWLKALFNAI